MAKTVKDAKLETRTAIDKLKTGETIFWKMLVVGKLSLGYRRRVAGKPGVWVARRFVGKTPACCSSGYLKTTLGRADDADRHGALSFTEAQKAAYAWADVMPGATPARPTVREAMLDYIAYQSTERKGAHAALNRCFGCTYPRHLPRPTSTS